MHDSCITFADDRQILLHLEAERVFRHKHMMLHPTQMDELIRVGLKYLNKTIDDVETVLLAKFNNKYRLKNFSLLGKSFNPIMTSHHINHVGTILPLKLKDSLVICADGGSEDGFTSIHLLKKNKLFFITDIKDKILNGRFYGNLTQIIIDPHYVRAHDFCPGKTMGLAALGSFSQELNDLILRHTDEMFMTYENPQPLNKIFGISMDYTRVWEDKRRRDLAFTAQKLWIDRFLEKISEYKDLSQNLTLVGGCALNVVLNSKTAKTGWFKNVYTSPVSGDPGQSLGAIFANNMQIKCSYPFVGRSFGDIEENDALIDIVTKDLLDHKIVAWFQGASGIGARALGHRSLLGLPDSVEMRVKLSERVKRREPYRPVAAILTEEFLPKFTDELTLSPYMTFAPRVKDEIKKNLPAIVHFDGTSRIQTLNKKVNPVLHKILAKIGEKTGYPVLMNSSLNIAGEPIADAPNDAMNTFRKSLADVLYINEQRFACILFVLLSLIFEFLSLSDSFCLESIQCVLNASPFT